MSTRFFSLRKSVLNFFKIRPPAIARKLKNVYAIAPFPEKQCFFGSKAMLLSPKSNAFPKTPFFAKEKLRNQGEEI